MTPMGTGNYGYDTGSPTQSAAVESAVDAYATKLLRQYAPPEACIDDNLGPYVTSMLRCAMPIKENVKDLADFDSLMELLEEHCSLKTNDALSALTVIADAVRTGVMDVDPVLDPTTDHLAALMLDENNDAIQFQFETEETTKINIHPATPIAEDKYQPEFSPAFETNPFARSGSRADKLIPVDLMGILDNPTTPLIKNTNRYAVQSPPQPKPEAFPPLGSSTPAASKKSIAGGKPPRNPKDGKDSVDGKDLAAALFRPRQHSIDSQDGYSSSSNQHSTSPTSPAEESVPLSDGYQQQYHQQQVESVIDMLLSMNPDLSEGAASAAAKLASADINVAQYVVDGAMSAPPICRHMLNDGCYRSDCQFSHDVDGHTCLFWIRGRCGKGDSCRFHHGFSKKLLSGINREALETKEDSPYRYASESKPVGIPTKNLVSHNVEAAPMNSWSSGGGFSAGGAYSFQSQSHGWDDYGASLSSSLNREQRLSSSWSREQKLSSSLNREHIMLSSSLNREQSPMSREQKEPNSFSFASVATKGYKNDSFAAKIAASSTNPSTKMKYVKIPQDLWNHHVNRDAGAFHIQDPLQRYAEVCKSVPRNDVIDLHFQSTKTFGIVLSNVLPLKLREQEEVWVVTGSGHHVARSSHQIKGGALEAAVHAWLETEGYTFVKGRDRNGHSGAVLVKSNR